MVASPAGEALGDPRPGARINYRIGAASPETRRFQRSALPSCTVGNHEYYQLHHFHFHGLLFCGFLSVIDICCVPCLVPARDTELSHPCRGYSVLVPTPFPSPNQGLMTNLLSAYHLMLLVLLQ